MVVGRFKLERRFSGPAEHFILLEDVSLLHSGQHDFTVAVISQQMVNHFIDMNLTKLAASVPKVDPSIVSVERFKDHIDVARLLADHSQVEHAKQSNVLVISVLDELEDDFLFWLNLQHLQEQTEKLGRPAVASVRAPNVLEIHRFVEDRLGCQGETVLFRVRVVVDFLSCDFVDQKLWV